MNKFLNRFNFYRPLTVIFDNDPNADPNNPNPNDPGTPAKPAGGSDPPKVDPKPDTFELTVDGQKKVVTLDEMRTMAQKSAGADAKFQEASELRNSAQNGIRLQELITRVNDPNQQPSDSDIKEIASIMGLDPTEFVSEYKQAIGNDTNPTNDKTGTTGNTPDISAEVQKAIEEQFGIPAAEVKQRLEMSYQRDIREAKAEIRQKSDNLVDKDEIFGKMIIDGDGKVNQDKLAIIKDRVAEEVLRGIQDGKPFGAELMTAAAQKVRAELTKFGILNKPDRYPVTLGFGPGNSLPIEVPIDKDVQRVSTLEDSNGDNFIKRIAQRVAKNRAGVRRAD